MSNFNYIENVPVRIAEKYKPPPRINQLPQSVKNKFNLPDGYFNYNPQFSYDFQLENKVLTKIPEYKRKRQIDRVARQERRARREKEHQLKIEKQQKEMLGAVSYPNTEFLSGHSDEEEDCGQVNDKKKLDAQTLFVTRDLNWLESHSYHNILKPTVISHNGCLGGNYIDDDGLSLSHGYKISPRSHAGHIGNCSKLTNSFNYKDFEEDTSSPFDYIELKTINDLDILRQVLYNTHIKPHKDSNDLTVGDEVTNISENSKLIIPNTKENLENVNNFRTSSSKEDLQQHFVSDSKTIENTKNALKEVNFRDMNLKLEQSQLQVDISPPDCMNSAHASVSHIPDNLNGTQQPNLFSPNNNNKSLTENVNLNFTTETSRQRHMFENSNNVTLTTTENANSTELSTKSRSVPDLFQELRDEVRNSEIRRTRSRNYSHNFECSQDVNYEGGNSDKKLEKKELLGCAMENSENKIQLFNNLTSSTKKLARKISSMGFPLGRVARIALVYGENDKKIVEHLIPLTELLDLGFDETKISEALFKFDNNKEKALEHLIP